MPKPKPQSMRPRPPNSGGKDDTDAWGFADHIRIVVYGESGTGKTTLAGTFPGRTLWLVCSGGVRSGELRSIDTPENRKRIRAFTIHDTDSLQEELDAALVGRTKWKDGHAGTPANIVMDHISGLQDLKLKEIGGLDEIPIQKNWGTFDRQEYGKAAEEVKWYVRRMMQVPCNLIILGQERVFGGRDDDADNDVIQPKVGTSVIPSLAKWLHPAMDYVCQTFVRGKTVTKEVNVAGKVKKQVERVPGVEHCLRIGKNDSHIIKFRVPGKPELPEYIVDPSYDKIMAVVKGKKA